MWQYETYEWNIYKIFKMLSLTSSAQQPWLPGPGGWGAPCWAWAWSMMLLVSWRWLRQGLKRPPGAGTNILAKTAQTPHSPPRDQPCVSHLASHMGKKKNPSNVTMKPKPCKMNFMPDFLTTKQETITENKYSATFSHQRDGSLIVSFTSNK